MFCGLIGHAEAAKKRPAALKPEPNYAFTVISVARFGLRYGIDPALGGIKAWISDKGPGLYWVLDDAAELTPGTTPMSDWLKVLCHGCSLLTALAILTEGVALTQPYHHAKELDYCDCA